MPNEAYTLASAGGRKPVRTLESLQRTLMERMAVAEMFTNWARASAESAAGGWGAGNIMFHPDDPAAASASSWPDYAKYLWHTGKQPFYPPNDLFNRWENYPDWIDRSHFGKYLDLRLDRMAGALNSNFRPRWTLAPNLTGESAPSRLPVSTIPILGEQTPHEYATSVLYNNPQLTTVAHTANNVTTPDPISLVALRKIAQPIVGQGLINQVRLWRGDVGGAHPDMAWRNVLPEAVLPSVAGNWGMPIMVSIHEEVNGLPGPDAMDLNSHAIAFYPFGPWQNETPDPALEYVTFFNFLRRVETRCDKRYWLVFTVVDDVNMIQDAWGNSTDLLVETLDHTLPEADGRRLKHWNGSDWVNLAAPALKFTVHMPKYLWRSKEIWRAMVPLKFMLLERSFLAGHKLIASYGYTDNQNQDMFTLDLAKASAKTNSTTLEYEYGVHQDYLSNFPYISTYEGPYGWVGGTRLHFADLQKYQDGQEPNIRYFYAAQFHNLRLQLREIAFYRTRVQGRAARFEFTIGVNSVTLIGNPPIGEFEVGEELNLIGGIADTGDIARIRVETIDEDGKPITFSVVNPGSYLRTAHPFWGELGKYEDVDGRWFLVQPNMQVQVVTIVDPGEGYVSDCAIQLYIDPAGGTSTEDYAKLRGIMVGGSITEVVILNRGKNYPSGGGGTSSWLLETADWTADPARLTAWPGIRYFVNGHTPWYGNNGFGVTYDGVDYLPGQSFIGNNQTVVRDTAAYYYVGGHISSGLAYDCHMQVGWPKEWPGYYQLTSATFQFFGQMMGSRFNSAANPTSSDFDQTGVVTPDLELPYAYAPISAPMVANTEWFPGDMIGLAGGTDWYSASPGVGHETYTDARLRKVAISQISGGYRYHPEESN